MIYPAKAGHGEFAVNFGTDVDVELLGYVNEGLDAGFLG